MNQKVSVIVPIYNVEKYIANAIKSVCAQSCRQLEVILVDDGSEDASVTIALEQLKHTSDICYTVIRQSNSGQGAARNAGVEQASGEWLLFLDADDVLQDNAVERLLDVGTRDSCDFVFSDFQKVSIGDEFQNIAYDHGEKILSGAELQRKFLVRQIPVIVPGTLYNKKWYKEHQLRFDSVRFSEDQHFLWQAIVKADRVGHVCATLYNYLTRPNSIMTGSKAKQLKDAYGVFCELQRELEHDIHSIPEVKKWMLDRWTLGMLRTGATILEWEDFRSVLVELNGLDHARNMRGFPEKKAFIMSNMLKISPKLYYKFVHKIGIK